MTSDDKTLVQELWRTSETARQFGVTPRTIKRYERQPDGLPFITVGGKNFNDPVSARAWLYSREKRLNPRRKDRGKKRAAVGARL